MNFYKTLGLKNSRIDVADALRGLAVAGIILYHSVEHFNMYDGSIAHAYTLGCDDWMADVLALLLSGKMYGIFALLTDTQIRWRRCCAAWIWTYTTWSIVHGGLMPES